MEIVLTCSVATIESALLTALVPLGHRVVLVGGSDKEDVAARWPIAVTALDAERAALLPADVAIVVDARVALRTGVGTVAMPEPAGTTYRARRNLFVDPHEAQAVALRDTSMRLVVDAVYGPGVPSEDLVSGLLAMVRSVPVVPTLPGSKIPFAPVFAADLARVVAAALETSDADWSDEHVLRGRETTTLEGLVDAVAELAKKRPLRVPLPAFLEGAGSSLLHLFGVRLASPDPAALERLHASLDDMSAPDGFAAFGVVPTPLRDALVQLSAGLPEQRAAEGYGALEHKRFWVDIRKSAFAPEPLLEHFRAEAAEILPIEFDVEHGYDGAMVVRGRSLTAALPGRGHIQMRVEETLPRRVTFATVQGHPVAGVVRFMTEARGDVVRFIVEVFARSGSPFDFVALKAGGAALQNLTWATVCKRMLERSAGESEAGVEHVFEHLDEAEAHRTEAWIESVIVRRERDEHAALAICAT